MHASDYAPTLTELQDKIDRLDTENKRLSGLYKKFPDYFAYEREYDKLEAKNAQLKRALGHPESDDSERQYMFCGYCGKEGAMTIDELQQHILSCEKHPIFKLEAENKRLKERIQKMYCGDLSPESRLNGYAVVVRNLQERLEMAQQALKEQK